MAEDLIRLMHALFWPATDALQETCWRPPADVYRGPHSWLVKFDLAGVRPEDVSLSVRGRFLTVQGCRRDELTEEGQAHYVLEIAYSRFERCIELPFDLESARIATSYRDGMLLVRIDMEIQS